MPASPPAEQRRAGSIITPAVDLLLVGGLSLLFFVPLLLSGRTDLGTAYANYNLGVTLMNLGHCSDALPYLETSRSIQPQRREVKDAIKQARRCQ